MCVYIFIWTIDRFPEVELYVSSWNKRHMVTLHGSSNIVIKRYTEFDFLRSILISEIANSHPLLVVRSFCKYARICSVVSEASDDVLCVCVWKRGRKREREGESHTILSRFFQLQRQTAQFKLTLRQSIKEFFIKLGYPGECLTLSKDPRVLAISLRHCFSSSWSLSFPHLVLVLFSGRFYPSGGPVASYQWKLQQGS